MRPFPFLLLTIAVACHAQSASPVIRHANILGGSGSDTPTAVATDPAGNIYILGQTASADLPNTKRLSAASTNDIFVAKVDPAGRNVLYSVVVGAGTAAAMAVDAAGSVYVAGMNPGAAFPLTASAIATADRCFLFKLNAAGSDLAYSTRLPCGSPQGEPMTLAVDGAGAAYVAGYSWNVTTTSGAYKTTGFGPYAMKVNAQGSALLYSTYLPGTESYASVRPLAMTLDTQGNAYFTGSADAKGLTPTVQPLPAEPLEQAGRDDVFVLQLSADGSKVLFSTLFGGGGQDKGYAIAVDAQGFIYVTGASHESTGPATPFPTTAGAFDREPGFPKGFLTKLAPLGTAAVFSTFLPDVHRDFCMTVSQAGVDVLGTQMFQNNNRLLRVSTDGAALINSSMVTLDRAICGGQAGRFALAGWTGRFTSPDLTPIGPRGGGDVWFAAVEPDMPEAPRFSIDTGQLTLYSWPGSGSKAVTIHAKASGGEAQFGISGNSHVSASPSQGTTPADVVVTAPGGAYTDSLIFFAPGARDGLVPVPVSMSTSNLTLSAQPLVNNRIAYLNAIAPDSPPVSVVLHVTSTASADIFGTPTSAELPFTVQIQGVAPSWLKFDPASGTTPAALRITADPAGLQPGSYYYAYINLFGPGISRPGLPQPLKFQITVQFKIGAAAIVPVTPSGPYLTSTPYEVSISLTPDKPSASATIHLTSTTGDPVAFKVDPTPSWLTVTPSSGTTPADLTLTATASYMNQVLEEYLQIRRASDNVVVGAARVIARALSPDYVGYLTWWPVDTITGYGTPQLAPGGLFYIGLDKLLSAPATALNAPPDALPFSFGGLSFKLNGIPVPLRAYQIVSSYFLAQVPPELTPGTYTLDEFDSSGARIATKQITIDPVAPRITPFPDDLRARRADGSIANATNPARPGEHITVRLTGQGRVEPAVPSGIAAPAGVTATPVAPVTAKIGGKAAVVVSAAMSHTEAGILEVVLEVPDLITGDYNIAVLVGNLDTRLVPLKVVAGAVMPLIQSGGVVSAASYLPQVAPGSLFSIFGFGLADGIAAAGIVPLPTSLAGVSVTIGGKQAPLLYVSPGQINGQVPYELAADPAAPVVVTVNGIPSGAGKMNVVAAAPGIFEFGQNRAVVQNQDYSLNTKENGASPRTTAIAYLTGSGALDNPVATGSPAPLSPLSRPLETVTATVNGMPAAVTFAGLAPTLIGVMQVNFQVPDLPPGTYPVVFTMNGGVSNSAVITVK